MSVFKAAQLARKAQKRQCTHIARPGMAVDRTRASAAELAQYLESSLPDMARSRGLVKARAKLVKPARLYGARGIQPRGHASVPAHPHVHAGIAGGRDEPSRRRG